jgi:hypothetical protein
VQDNAAMLREAASRFGLRSQLDLNVVEYFDFYPSEHVELDMTVICQLLPWSLPAVPRTTQAT